MRRLSILTLLVSAAFITPLHAGSKPPIALAADGLPSGHDTPEGAATDLGRAFINKDSEAFEDACVRPYGGGESRQEYEQFLKDVA